MKLYFIHIPKTAGTYVTEFLRGQLGDQFVRDGHTVPKHCLHDWTERFGPEHFASVNPDECVSFSVVRNPFNLLVSMYEWGFPYWPPKNYAGARQVTWPFRSFREYVDKICDPSFPWIVPEQQKSLFFQLFDDKWRVIPDFIIKQENISSGLQELGDELGFSWPSSPQKAVNKNVNRPFFDYYDPCMAQKIAKTFNWDLTIFRYGLLGDETPPLIRKKDLTSLIEATSNPSVHLRSDELECCTGRYADQERHDVLNTMLDQASGRQLAGALFRRLRARLS